MPSKEQIIEGELCSETEPLWSTVWTRACDETLAEKAVDLIDLDRGAPLPQWDQLDESIRRALLVPLDSPLVARCVKLILPHTARLKQALVASGHHSEHGKALSTLVATAVIRLAQTPHACHVFTPNPFPRMWPLIGHAVARRIMETDPEWLILNKLILAAYFVTCQLSSARYVGQHLRERPHAKLSVRGTFIRIVESLSANGVEDRPPPISERTGGITLRHAPLSDLLHATAEESRRIPTGSGVLHRIGAPNHPPSIPPEARRLITMGQMLQGRDLAYRQHEYTILAYMALASIEQLLRAWASHSRITHLKTNGQPLSVLKWILSLPCSAALAEGVRDLYDVGRSNVRNRVMHGGLLEIENKQFEMAMAFVDSHGRTIAPQARDAYSPENIAQLCLGCLEMVDQEAPALAPEDFDWAEHLRLSDAEVGDGISVHWDLTGPEAEQWSHAFESYFTAAMPALTQFFRVGYIGWGNSFVADDALPCVIALMSIFETKYRLTAHLLGEQVLQADWGGKHFQYLMLDQRGLCAQPIVDRMLAHIEPSDRAMAERVMRLAVKARNSFAHGALVRFDRRRSKGTGHLVMKSLQTLLTAGQHHMTKEAAYLHWLTACRGQSGHDLRCWLAGERQILREISAAAEH
jgi:hypothetical protein